MKKFLSFACASCVFGVASVMGQVASKAPASDPFRIDTGSSFSASASAGKSEAATTRRSTLSPSAGKIISDIGEAFELIRRSHVNGNSIDHNELTKSSVGAMLAELDPHSNYFDPEEFSELLGEQDSEYSGTGSTISNFVRDGKTETYILSTHADSAASRAGLRYGDRIVAVDGVEVSGLASNLVRDRVRGPRGTMVTMKIERADSGRIDTIVMKRDRVFQPTLPNFFIVRNGVGYVDLSEGFSHTTSAEFAAALKELNRRGMTSMILDLRGNGGGILDQAIKVAEEFLPAGTSIMSQRGRFSIDDREWKSGNRRPENIPLVVLVDEQTASASEIVAGALQDNDRALIMGQNTFGKGLVQNVVGLPMGSGLTLTTARYYTPSGRSIQRTYSGTGMYDYFNHRSPNNAQPQSHTLTNRVVLGGNGIAPDELFEDEKFDSQKAALLDPIFFFVRDLVNGRASAKEGTITSRDQIRQSIIFGVQPVGEELMAKFLEYAKRSNTEIPASTFEANSRFIMSRLNHDLALATFGPGSAKQAQIISDRLISKAIDSLPKAAALSEAARQARTTPPNKKTRRVAFPTGQGRNRRN